MAGIPPVVYVYPKAGRNIRKASTKSQEAGSASSSAILSARPKWGSRVRSRSRSPPHVALPGFRDEAPGRLERRHAADPQLNTKTARAEALASLERDIKAVSIHGPDVSRLRTMEGWLQKWGLTFFPPTIVNIKAIGATLKAGNYKSAAVYLHTYKVEAERRGFATTQLQARALKDSKRSCMRGLALLPVLDLLSLNCWGVCQLAAKSGSARVPSILELQSSWVPGGFAGSWSHRRAEQDSSNFGCRRQVSLWSDGTCQPVKRIRWLWVWAGRSVVSAALWAELGAQFIVPGITCCFCRAGFLSALLMASRIWTYRSFQRERAMWSRRLQWSKRSWQRQVFLRYTSRGP